MTVTLYWTSVTCSMEVKKQQQWIMSILSSKDIAHDLVDISQDSALRDCMREKCGNPTALPPQIFNRDHYCGDYGAFCDAVESETLNEFLCL